MVYVNIVSSKTRVVPIKGQSAPQLELLGAGILARLMHLVYMVDSIHWLLMSDCFTGQILTGNRIYNWLSLTFWELGHTSQHKLFPRFFISYPGTSNPSDLPSWGCKASTNDLWWKGPSLLHESPDTWPDLPTSLDPSEADMELIRKQPVDV